MLQGAQGIDKKMCLHRFITNAIIPRNEVGTKFMRLEYVMIRHNDQRYSLTNDGIPFEPRPCFNWLPQYRYGLYAYKALQQACANMLTDNGDSIEFTKPGTAGAHNIPLHLVRPALMDSVIQMQGWKGYVLMQAEDSMRRFSDGRLFYPLTKDIALLVAKETGSSHLLNNVLSYTTPAPQSIEANLAIGGGYFGATPDEITASHHIRRGHADEMLRYLSNMFQLPNTSQIRLHSAGVGGLIEAATKYMDVTKPSFKTCLLVPEYWDLLRCVLTYSPRGVTVVDGRHNEVFPEEDWLQAISQPSLDFSYISFTNNPLGTTVPKGSLFKAIDAINDDTLFLIDFTSVDTDEPSSEEVIKQILADFPGKNLLITKSFSKEYNQAHIRVGYGVFSRPEIAEAIWPYMAAYSPASILLQAKNCLAAGTADVIRAYSKTKQQLFDFARSHPRIRVTGTNSNYTSLFFPTENECSEALQRITESFGPLVYPGELPMQGGGHMGLSEGEVSLTSMKRIPFLPTNALRLLVTESSVDQIGALL